MLHAADVVPNHPSWTDAEILAALRRYRDEFARAPAKQDLDWPPQGYPSARTVRRHFGSFTAGIRAAGLEPAQRRFSRARLIELIREFNAEHGRPPRSTDWAQASERWPSAATVQNRFGTWAAALEAAGVPPVVGRRRSSTCA